jgi:C-methyltransferase C-terminal domain/Putative zinc binding domain/Methyltransferase domain
MNCRHCQHPLKHVFLDLGYAPPSNAYLKEADLAAPETHFPLKLYVCDDCWLVQTEDYSRRDELFTSEYAYFSSTSSGWLAHAKQYCDDMTQRLGLNSKSLVIEVASNDGYLLKNFVASGVPCLGIEPTISTALAAEALGVPVLREFFGLDLAKQLVAEGKKADLILGNNVYAHVPDINDFTAGLAEILNVGGTVTLEFPHLMQLLKHNQFDTVYHEHYSYLSLQTVQRVFAKAGLRVFDVQEIGTHGGSLRVFGCRENDPRPPSAQVNKVLADEVAAGMNALTVYQQFQPKADKVKNDLMAFLIKTKEAGKSIAAYGAAAKGNTLMNYAGVRPDLLPFVCDAAKAKQNHFMPGSHIPILPPQALLDAKPDYVLILPWNIGPEVMAQNASLRENGTKFVVAVPQLTVL